MNIGLTLDTQTVLEALSPVMDRLIEEDAELLGVWYAFAEYLAIYINRRIHHVVEPWVDDNTLIELRNAYLGIEIPTAMIRANFDAVIRTYRDSFELVIRQLLDAGCVLRQVDGHWSEPVLYHTPMLVFLTHCPQPSTPYWQQETPSWV